MNKKWIYSILPYLGAKDGFRFLQEFAESCSSSRRQLAVDNSLWIHISDTHILIGCLHLQTSHRHLDHEGRRMGGNHGYYETNTLEFKPKTRISLENRHHYSQSGGCSCFGPAEPSGMWSWYWYHHLGMCHITLPERPGFLDVALLFPSEGSFQLTCLERRAPMDGNRMLVDLAEEDIWCWSLCAYCTLKRNLLICWYLLVEHMLPEKAETRNPDGAAAR